MNRSRQILLLHQHRAPLRCHRGGAFKGDEVQEGNGFKGDEFQEGFDDDEFRRMYGGGASMVGIRNRMFCRRQRGAGWGWLSRFAARALPYLTRGAKAVGDQVVSTLTDQTLHSGLRFLDDVVDGENVLKSAKHRLKEGRTELKDTIKSTAREQGLKLAATAKRKLAEKARLRQQEGGGMMRVRRGAVVSMGPRSVEVTKRRGRRRSKVSRARAVGARGRASASKKKKKKKKAAAAAKKTTNLGYKTIFD
jgi:hypothetical protein